MKFYLLRREDQDGDLLWFAGSNNWTSDIQQAVVYKKVATAKSVRSQMENRLSKPVQVVEFVAKEEAIL